MEKNKCDDQVPPEVVSAAARAGCAGGVRYVYRDGQYGGKHPVASLGCTRPTRFRSDVFKYFKIVIAPGWVAFKSWRNERQPAIPGSEPPLLSSLGVITVTKKIDGSPLVFRVEDEIVFLALSNPRKAFRVQLLRMWDEAGFDNGVLEYRICYYMIAHKPRMKDRWAFGQFAPMFTPEEFDLLLRKMQQKGWATPPPGLGRR